MANRKLYRQQMAKLAGITPVQLDYFVRLGAFSPDLGDQRKHYSPYEAALVLIAGQLMPQFKDQRTIVEALGGIRDFVSCPGVEPRSYHALAKAEWEATQRGERQQRAEAEALGIDTLSGPKDVAQINRTVAAQFITFQGIWNDKPLDSQAFMRFYCDQEGLDFDFEFESEKKKYENLLLEPISHSPDELTVLVLKGEYFRAIAGYAPQYLQVAVNADGSVFVNLDVDTMPLNDRYSWLTLNLGRLFERLAPYIDKNFIHLASDYLKTHEAQRP